MAVSADFKISASGRKVHKMKKIADTEDDLEDKEDDKEVKESTLDEEFSSGNAQHSLSGKSEKQQHSDYMKKTHNVTTKYHGSDEVSYHGSKANVKKALVNHYDDEGEAKEMHPHAFKESVDESVVPAHMQGKQKPYVSSDGKGNYEVLGNKGQTKAEFSRKEHGKDAHKKAQSHLKTKYNEYMKEGRSDVVIQTTAQNMDDNDKHVTALRDAGIHASQGAGASHHIIVPPEHADKARRILAGHLKEETQLEEAVDKQEQRFIQLARLGLVDKSNVSKLRIAIDQLKADKLLTVQQRSLLLSVMMDLVDLVTGDDAVFQRVKMDVQKESVEDLDENTAALQKKASASGVSLGVLKTVYKRGVAAWNSGHRPGTTPQQWGMARVNSYITKGKGTYGGADKDLHEDGEPTEFDVNEIDEACWDSHKQVGMKKKNGKMVPNCVPKNESIEEDSRADNPAYHKGVSDSTAQARVSHWKKMDKLSDRDPKAYEPAPGDATAKTKTSKHTKKYHDMFGENYVSDAQRKAVWASRNDAKKEETDPPFDGPYTKVPSTSTDKSGAQHTPMSRARHLAKLALAKQANKSKAK